MYCTVMVKNSNNKCYGVKCVPIWLKISVKQIYMQSLILTESHTLGVNPKLEAL